MLRAPWTKIIMFLYINYSNRDCLFDPGLDKEQNRNNKQQKKRDKTQNDAARYCIYFNWLLFLLLLHTAVPTSRIDFFFSNFYKQKDETQSNHVIWIRIVDGHITAGKSALNKIINIINSPNRCQNFISILRVNSFYFRFYCRRYVLRTKHEIISIEN